MGDERKETSAVFLGIGTGRCGTVSLARIVAACHGTEVSHEEPAYRSPWESPDTAALDRFIESAREASARGVLFGDVAFYWLPHLEYVRAAIPGLKVICLKRDREATVRSFLHKCPGFSLLRPQDRPCHPEWWDRMPTIDAPTVEEAWGRYWDYYYERAAELPGALHLRTEDLDDNATLERVFDYLDIAPAERVFIERRRFNSAEETVPTTPLVELPAA